MVAQHLIVNQGFPSVPDISAKQLEQKIAKGDTFGVIYYSPECQVCQLMGQELQNFRDVYRDIPIYAVDVTKTGNFFGGQMAKPKLEYYIGGELHYVMEGFNSSDQLKKIMDSLDL
ncbi:hypothetical protein GCM10010965_29900 [Caldalkalibacillus thermarum]|uniref:thioredoxin family protein n=1 Tax=Caldalkalibacillus thermarum TaxID=296745 RepID=UPI00166A1F0A|nr:thioredoxin family protein [Caldalkalibacillus thermarum]GGK34982.1 hypothetical protein GCM10010965_29900 [Caldalkalibacillus thermarum]